MTRKLYAIGDIHGHYEELTNLMGQLHDDGLKIGRDELVFIGDYVDGGPDSKKVVDFIKSMHDNYERVVCIKGNHEDMLVRAIRTPRSMTATFDHWFNSGGRFTYLSYREGLPEGTLPWEAIPTEHVDWMDSLPLMHETDRYYFVHAGFSPFRTAYSSDPYDMLWIRGEFINTPHDYGKRVIFGHTAFRNPWVDPFKIGIDTMFHNTGKLTAVELSGPEPRFFFSPSVTDPR